MLGGYTPPPGPNVEPPMEDRGIAANPNPVSLFSPRGCIAAVLRCCRTGRHLANERAQTPPRAAANTTLRLYAPLGFYVPFYYPTCDCSVAFTARPSRRPTGPLGAGLTQPQSGNCTADRPTHVGSSHTPAPLLCR